MRTQLILLGGVLLFSGACDEGGATGPGTGGTGGSVEPPLPLGDNVIPVVVDSGVIVTTSRGTHPIGYTNGIFATLTVCVPGTATCQTIDHVLVDTGSVGLRLLESALTIALPEHTDALGRRLAGCAQFVDGAAWGPLRTADVTLGGAVIAGLPIQTIGTSVYPIAEDCTGTPLTQVAELGSNGILGVGLFQQDCGTACTRPASSPVNPGFYYACSLSTGCTLASLPLDRQIPNPVAKLSRHNNGVMIQLPNLPSQGAPSVTGALVLGIGTDANNALGNATVLSATTAEGYLSAYLPQGGKDYGAFIDSGSNGNFFLDTSITKISLCSGDYDVFYCPAKDTLARLTLAGHNGAKLNVEVAVGNADTLFKNRNHYAFGNLSGPMPGFPQSTSLPGVDLGLSFHFGRRIFSAIEGQSTPAGPGPYFAL